MRSVPCACKYYIVTQTIEQDSPETYSELPFNGVFLEVSYTTTHIHKRKYTI